MSLSIVLPAGNALSPEITALNGFSGPGANGAGVSLPTGSNIQPAGDVSSATSSNASSSDSGAGLSALISSVAKTVSNLKTTIPPELSELLESPGFQLLFQVISGADGGGQDVAAISPASSDLSSATISSGSAAGSTADLAATAGSGSGSNTTYFNQLIGELQSAYSTDPAVGTNAVSSAFNSSELDLFLKWLSTNGSNGVVASA